MERAQKIPILRDLHKKMVLLSGPRQVGKTTLAKQVAREFKSSVYLNYDHWEDRQMIERQAWRPSVEPIVLDEIHKMDDWKNYLKGFSDGKRSLGSF
ncbi:MAG: AAA family ATPase [Chlamydiota bacterium]